jgi:hypothetical protein
LSLCFQSIILAFIYIFWLIYNDLYYLIKVIFKNFQRKGTYRGTSRLCVSSFASGNPLLPVGCQPRPQSGSVSLCQVSTARPCLLMAPWAAEGLIHADAGCRLRLKRGECCWWG